MADSMYDIFSYLELCTDLCDMGLCVIILKYVAVDELYNNGPRDLVTVSLCIHMAIDKMQLCSLSVAYACPCHNPKATMGHKSLAHTTPYTLSVICPVQMKPGFFSRYL